MIDSKETLRTLYPPAKERSVKKQLGHLDSHCLRFVGLSPFVVLASGSKEGHLDASPRGGEPGFVQAPDSTTLLIPDAPGNNRLDTLENTRGWRFISCVDFKLIANPICNLPPRESSPLIWRNWNPNSKPSPLVSPKMNMTWRLVWPLRKSCWTSLHGPRRAMPRPWFSATMHSAISKPCPLMRNAPPDSGSSPN